MFCEYFPGVNIEALYVRCKDADVPAGSVPCKNPSCNFIKAHVCSSGRLLDFKLAGMEICMCQSCYQVAEPLAIGSERRE